MESRTGIRVDMHNTEHAVFLKPFGDLGILKQERPVPVRRLDRAEQEKFRHPLPVPIIGRDAKPLPASTSAVYAGPVFGHHGHLPIVEPARAA